MVGTEFLLMFNVDCRAENLAEVILLIRAVNEAFDQ